MAKTYSLSSALKIKYGYTEAIFYEIQSNNLSTHAFCKWKNRHNVVRTWCRFSDGRIRFNSSYRGLLRKLEWGYHLIIGQSSDITGILILEIRCFFRTTLCSSGNSLAVQWLQLHAFTAEGMGSIPRWGSKILQALWHSQNKQNRKKEKPVCSYKGIFKDSFLSGTQVFKNLQSW